ncbi:hypothetical protein T484DRAFT_1955320 [Baffinella frigidus]|nr:hypothetical protein T484DRAFT_1955320 [Cryptophyta sp. CCMP2293]
MAKGNSVAKKAQAQALKASHKQHLMTLRKALIDGTGKDRDVTKDSDVQPFTAYTKNGLDLEIDFMTNLKPTSVSQWAFALVKANMKKLYDDSDFGWCDLDKKDELFDHGGAARFFVVRQRTGEKKPVGFVSFRFTLQGEAVGVIGGAPTLYVMDLQLEGGVQRKGLGSHLVKMLEVVARKQGMMHVMLPVVREDANTKAFCLNSSFLVDDLASILTVTDGASDAAELLLEDNSFIILSKILSPPSDAALSAAGTPEKEGAAALSALAPGVEPQALSFDPTFGAGDAAKDGTPEDTNDEQAVTLMKALEDVGGLPLGLDQAAKTMLLSLLEVFKEQTGRDPTQEDIVGWVAKIKEHGAEGGEEDSEEGESEEDSEDDEDEEDA